ncbi:urease accessory protein UreG [Marinobacter nauticus]|uniref:GTP-binding protein n=1 Tax=Marinobacter nauticus TaxID=2743 RepID=UPI00112FC885|nr:GTP-binding protein [Marinobacter nauticus]TPW24466.1 urease accessory protein UreG [Marinobacter nauticus]
MFSPELGDFTPSVIGASARDNSPRKSAPSITESDLLIINEIDTTEQVHISLDVMKRDSRKVGGEKPFVFTNLWDGVWLETIMRFTLERGMLPERRPEKLAETA